MFLMLSKNYEKKGRRTANIPELQRQHKISALGITRNLHMIKIGMEDKKEPTSMMKKDHEQGQDQKLDSRTEYQDRIPLDQHVPRYAA